MKEQQAEAVLKRLEVLEQKLDACLILLQMATTHDDFTYTLSDKSERWRQAMKGAGIVASRAEDSVIKAHQEYITAQQTSDQPREDIRPNEKETQ